MNFAIFSVLNDQSDRSDSSDSIELEPTTANCKKSLMPARIFCKTLVHFLPCIFLILPTAHAATFQIADPIEFSKIIDTNAVLTTNATLNTWLEGPVWVPSGGGYLVFCDQNNNRLKKLVPPATVTDFLLPPANTLLNGTMLDAQERLIAAEAGSAGLKISMVTNG